MGITEDRGRWYFVKRVPKRYRDLDPRDQVRVALWTDSKAEAQAKAPRIEAELEAYWQALETGNSADAEAHFAAVRQLAERRGFSYRPATDLIAGDFAELFRRIESLERGTGATARPVEYQAVLGGVEAPILKMSEAPARYFEATRADRAGKTDRADHRFRTMWENSVATFIEVAGDKRLNEYNRGDAIKFKDHWQDRILHEGKSAGTANKQIGHLAKMFRHFAEVDQLPLGANPFDKLRITRKKSSRKKRPPFATEWIRDVILAPGALATTHEEIRDVIEMIVNTGARPGEILGADPEDYRLDAPIPYIVVWETEARELKNAGTAREIPLLGVSLDAARRLAARGGVVKYRDDPDGFSAAANKYMRTRGLLPTPKHVVYSLRHSFEDRLLASNVDGRIRADLMGHSYDRPTYGNGGRLPHVAAEIAKIAL